VDEAGALIRDAALACCAQVRGRCNQPSRAAKKGEASEVRELWRELRKQVVRCEPDGSADQDCSLLELLPVDHVGAGAGAGAGSLIIGAAGFGAAGFRAAFFAGFFALFFAAFFATFLADFFADFLADFFATTFLAFLLFFAFFAFLAFFAFFAIMVLLLPHSRLSAL
jgi:hypothetical protein